MASSEFSDVGALLLRTIGFDPSTVSPKELRKIVDQQPILSEVESTTISLLIRICESFFEDSTKVHEFYEDLRDLIRHGVRPESIIAKIEEMVNSNRSSQDRFHESFSRIRDNVAVMRWRNTFLSEELRAAEASLEAHKEELSSADHDIDSLAKENTEYVIVVLFYHLR